jgi:ferredoxin--NADP+ reductase
MSLTLAASATFRPGQFMNLGLHLSGGFASRSYSLASAPGAPLEVLLSRVGEGVLSPALFDLSAGSAITLDPKPQGFFSFDYVPPHEHLWLLATGTGLAPFMSMLRSGEAFARARRVVLAHGARGAEELAYRSELESLARARPEGFTYLPVLSRRAEAGLLSGRITDALASGQLEARAELRIDSESAHFLLCGNPAMIEQVTAQLQARGLRRHRQRAPGHITTEKYW